jgi:formamidopyrimidine-DNA glycosylase
MPELPEVETTLRGLQPVLDASPLTRIESRAPRLRYPLPQVVLANPVRVEQAWRRSKYIILDLANSHSCLIHLGMSGRLVQNQPPAKHDHVLLHFADGQHITLNDPRRFGMFLYEPTEHMHTHKLLVNLGPEPLSAAFTSTYLYNQLKKRSSAIKTALMDAKLVVGVGNIYANEALFRARIRPTRKANAITKHEAEILCAEIKAVLEEAINAGGSSLKDYVQSDGKLGLFQNNFFVYGREGVPCLVCKTPITRSVVGQRATFHCAKCQPR